MLVKGAPEVLSWDLARPNHHEIIKMFKPVWNMVGDIVTIATPLHNQPNPIPPHKPRGFSHADDQYKSLYAGNDFMIIMFVFNGLR